MRTYLDLVKRLHQETGTAGDPPTAVTGHSLSSDQQRLCDWIADAWIEILKLHPNWKFRRRSTSFPTVNGQGDYTQAQCGLVANTLGQWIFPSFRVYHTATGQKSEQYLTEIRYDEWRDTYNFGANRTAYSVPRVIAHVPSTDGIALGPIPLSGYTVLGDYYLAPQRLAASADLPDLPERHDSLGIVWKAMMDFGGYKSRSEIYQRAAKGYADFINRLERDQLEAPTICVGMGV